MERRRWEESELKEEAEVEEIEMEGDDEGVDYPHQSAIYRIKGIYLLISNCLFSVIAGISGGFAGGRRA